MAKILIFSDGTKATVKEDGGKYWITEKSQFRKSNGNIVEVVDEPDKEDKPKKSQPKKAKDSEAKEESKEKSE